MKSQNCSKQKKNRKSPGLSEFDVAAANRAEDVQSPAYSDISDDSAPVVDASDLGEIVYLNNRVPVKRMMTSHPFDWLVG